MGLKEKIKTEIGYMKKGAKVLPKVAGKKMKGWIKGQYQAAKERAAAEREIEAESRKAETEAYREERIRQAKLAGQAKGKSKAAGKGILAQLGEAGERMSLSDLIGGGKGIEEVGSTSDYLFSGLGKPRKEASSRRVVHHVHHYPKRKKRK